MSTWYRQGTISVTNGNATVTGIGTAWGAANTHPGDVLLAPDGKLYEILSIDSVTQLTIKPTFSNQTGYQGTTDTSGNAKYAIAPLVGSTTTADLAQRISAILTAWQDRQDELSDWQGGTVTGGDGNGYYPLTDSLGAVTHVMCPAKITYIVGNLDAELTTAQGYATSAQSSATSAQTYASQAGTSATNAGNSATAASTSATNASNSATSASSSASTATTKASEASSSASSAASSASSASTSATNAASSAASAAASAASIDTSNFVDKTTNQTVAGNKTFTGNTALGDAAGDTTTVPDLKALQVTSPARASIRPSLLLDFANSKVLDPRVTFTRASTATYFDRFGIMKTAAANEPRFDHNPVTGESLGLLIEEQRTNLLTYSEDFSNAAWVKTNSTVSSNVVVAPDGTLTGDKLIEDTSTSLHLTQQAITTSATTYTVSVYAKEAGRTQFRFSSNFGMAPGAQFDLSAVTATVLGTTTLATITHVGNGWYRCTATGTVSAGSDVTQILLGTGNSYTGDGTSGIYIWGAQLEAGAFPTSYIPTTSAQVTRSADIASMTGTNFSSWYRADEGTLYGEGGNTSTGTGNSVLATVTNNSILQQNDRVALFNRPAGTSGLYAIITVNTVGQTDFGNVNHLAHNKMCIGYKNNDSSAAFNGVSSATDINCLLPVVSQLEIGRQQSNPTITYCGTIKKLAYYPKRLTNAELQGLTAL